MNSIFIEDIPEQGQLVEVRGRRFVVSNVSASRLTSNPMQSGFMNKQHLVTLASVEDDALGEELEVIWELELGASIYEERALPIPDCKFNGKNKCGINLVWIFALSIVN